MLKRNLQVMKLKKVIFPLKILKMHEINMEKSLQMLKKILASQVDFKNQKPLLQEIIEAKGHRVFDSIPLKQIRKYALRLAKYMECYRKGLTVLQAEYALKKYKSHRRIPDNKYYRRN